MKIIKKQKQITIIMFCILINFMFIEFCYAGIDFIKNYESINWLEIPVNILKKYNNTSDAKTNNIVRILYSHDKILYAITEQGFFQTKNKKTWDFVNGWNKNNIVKNLYSHNDNLYVFTNNCIFKKVKESAEIEEKSQWIKEYESNDISINVLYEYKNNLYAGTSAGILKLNNEGVWNNINIIKNDEVTLLCSNDDFLYATISNNKKLLILKENIEENNLMLNDVQEISSEKGTIQVLYSNDDCLYVGTSTGIFVIKTGDNELKSCSDELRNKSIKTLFSYDKQLYIGTKNDGVFLKKQNKWMQVGLLHECILSLIEYNNELYSVTGNGIIFKINNNIVVWQKDENLTSLNIKSLITHKKYLYSLDDNGKILRFNHEKEKWLKYMNGLENNKQINTLCENIENLYAESTEGFIYKLQNNLSGENSWIKIGDKIKDSHITSLVFYKNYLHIGTMNGVYKLNEISTILKNPKLKDLQINILYLCDNNLYAGTEDGVYFLENTKEDWKLIGIGLDKKNINSLYKYHEYLYAGTFFYGIYRLNLNSRSNTWMQVLPKKTVTSFYSKDDILYAGTTEGDIFVAKNDGDDWAKIDQIGRNPIFFNDNDNDIYAKTSDGVYKISEIPADNKNISKLRLKIFKSIKLGATIFALYYATHKFDQIRTKKNNDKVNGLIKYTDNILSNKAISISLGEARTILDQVRKNYPENISIINIANDIAELESKNKEAIIDLITIKGQINIKNIEYIIESIKDIEKSIVNNREIANSLVKKVKDLDDV